MMFQMRRFQF